MLFEVTMIKILDHYGLRQIYRKRINSKFTLRFLLINSKISQNFYPIKSSADRSRVRIYKKFE